MNDYRLWAIEGNDGETAQLITDESVLRDRATSRGDESQVVVFDTAADAEREAAYFRSQFPDTVYLVVALEPSGSHTYGSRTIGQERLRQITGKGFADSRDDQYTDQELIAAAHAYLAACDDHTGDTAVDFWPWDHSTFKPSEDRVRNLQKAGALIAAEIDRLLRKAMAPALSPTPEVSQ